MIHLCASMIKKPYYYESYPTTSLEKPHCNFDKTMHCFYLSCIEVSHCSGSQGLWCINVFG